MQSRNEQFVQSLLERGEFATREQLIDAALEHWRTQRDEVLAAAGDGVRGD